MPEGDNDRGFWVRCTICAHCWIASYWPSEVSAFVKRARANAKVCPKCGAGASKITVAKQDNGELQEPINV
jgi:hypothetical protein